MSTPRLAPPRLAPPRLDGEERRRAIVDACAPLFARKGFARTTTREIAEAAGVSEALVFKHFPSKAALYDEICHGGDRGEPELAWLRQLEPSTATLVRFVQAMATHFVVGCATQGDTRHRLMVHSFIEDGDYARQVIAWVMAEIFPLFQASLAAAKAAGDVIETGLDPVTALMLGKQAVAGFAYALLPDPPVMALAGTREAVADQAARFILRGLGLTEPALARHYDPALSARPIKEPRP